MDSLRKLASKTPSGLFSLHVLHILNDGFQASLLLLLPFIAKDLNITLTQVGVLGTIVGIFGIVLALPAGYIATKIGGLKTLVLALVIYGIGYLGTGFAANYFLLLLMFTLGGIGFGVFHPIAFALVAKWSPKEKRGQIMGNFTAIGDVGRIGLSTVLTFTVVYIGWRMTSFLHALIALVFAIGCYFLLVKNSRDRVATEEQKNAGMSWWQVIKNKRLVFATTTAFLDSFASSSLYVFLPFLLLKRGVDPAFLGAFAAAFFIGNFFGKTYLGKFTDRIGNSKVFIASELLMACFIFLLANSTAFSVIIGCSVILGVFTKGTVPVLQTMITESVEHHGHFEKAFGFNSLATSIATTVAPLIFGFVADALGIVIAFNIMALAAVMAIIPAFGFHVTKGQGAMVER